MTYIDMVNNILKRLRERTVSSVSENAYSTLIGILVNDAMREVENAWNWSQSRSTITVATVASTDSYELDATGYRSVVLDVWDDTSDNWVKPRESAWIRKQLDSSDSPEGQPIYYSYTDDSADGDQQIQVYPTPDGVYSLKVRTMLRSTELSGDADTTYLPSQPILLLAYAKAIEERGEDGGVAASSAYMTAKGSLADAISFDATRFPEDTIWREV